MANLLYLGGGHPGGAERVRAALLRAGTGWQLVLPRAAVSGPAGRADAPTGADPSLPNQRPPRDTAPVHAVCVHETSSDRVLQRLRSLRIDGHHTDLPLVVVSPPLREEQLLRARTQGAVECLREDQLHLLGPALDLLVPDAERDSTALDLDRRARLDRRAEQRTLMQAYRRLTGLSARLVDAQERERALIARELHDELGQTMTGIVLHLHAAQRATARGAPPAGLDSALELASHAVEQVRRMSFMLRPPQLDLLGLSAAVRSTVERLLSATDLRYRVRVSGSEPARTPSSWIAAFRIVQEALTNVVRHAHARRVEVRLRFLPGGGLAIVVADDGRGFDLLRTLSGGVSDANYGLNGLFERAQMAGGRVAIRSAVGRGTVVRALFDAQPAE